ncbi:hypothetical protein HPP92_001161 [Vanilla planifolia]|uniref:Pentatricopeptide repeat-containing protein n=1 Tax=Vanilla planifolia TaxID=51239 RepID=A0A835S443_VANPL|nr:hypothetical protein HPP92_001161 [Vanilla planifolia]
MRVVAVPLANYVELSSLLSICGREKHHRLGSSIHAAITKNNNLNNLADSRNVVVIWNSLISMYSKCGQLQYAAKVLDEMPLKDTVSWNSMISGCMAVENFTMGFQYFRRMRSSNISGFDRVTLTTVVSICSKPELLYTCFMLHALILSSGYGNVVQVGNALITAYSRSGSCKSAKRVFDGMVERNVITWTAMVSGFAQSQLLVESLLLFREMLGIEEANSVTYATCLVACSGIRAVREGLQIHGRLEKSGFLSDLHVESALMDMYSKCGMVGDALMLFHSCVEPDEIFLTVMLVSLAQNGMEVSAFNLFAEMVARGIYIDENMLSAVLGAFGVSILFSLALGKQIHSLVVKKCFLSNVFVCNGLINMYSKCGELKDSTKLFYQMPHKNSVTWNSMIAAFGRHGYGSEALKLYEEMMTNGFEPSDLTFLSLLQACSHTGSVEKGVELLKSMYFVHGIIPRAEHYACVVDMLGRAGQFHEARSFVDCLHVEHKYLLWQALLGACSFHGEAEMGRYAAEQLIATERDCHSSYVLLANIHSVKERWEERGRTIKKMKEKGVKKEIAVSWIEVGKEVHSFVVGDDLHPHAESIYKALSELNAFIRAEQNSADEQLMMKEMEVEASES